MSASRHNMSAASITVELERVSRRSFDGDFHVKGHSHELTPAILTRASMLEGPEYLDGRLLWSRFDPK